MKNKMVMLILIITCGAVFENTISRIIVLEKKSPVQITCAGYRVNPVTLNYTGRNCAILTTNEFVKANKGSN